MIKIDLAFAIAIFLCVGTILFFLFWLIGNKRDRSQLHETETLVQCPFCTQVFYNYKKETLLKCPHCQSYIEEK